MPVSKDARKRLLCECRSYLQNTTLNNHRRVWVHRYNNDRDFDHELLRVYKKLRSYPDKFYNYARMSVDTVDGVLDKVTE